MRGTVKFVNADDGVVGVETENGTYTVFGMLEDYDVAVGDIITGELESLDQQQLTNETRQVVMNAYVEDCKLPQADAEVRVG